MRARAVMSVIAPAVAVTLTVLRREGRNNVLSTYAYAATHGVGYHLAYIGADSPDVPDGDATAQFSTSYMLAMFASGVAQGRRRGPGVKVVVVHCACTHGCWA